MSALHQIKQENLSYETLAPPPLQPLASATTRSSYVDIPVNSNNFPFNSPQHHHLPQQVPSSSHHQYYHQHGPPRKVGDVVGSPPPLTSRSSLQKFDSLQLDVGLAAAGGVNAEEDGISGCSVSAGRSASAISPSLPCSSPPHQLAAASLFSSAVGGSVAAPVQLVGSLPSRLTTYRTSERTNSLSWEEGSVSAYESDRPNSRLTLVESPSDGQELEEEGSLSFVGSPDQPDEDLLLGSPSGPFACEECFESFPSVDQLRHHELCHTGESTFQCQEPGCVKSFTSKFKLKRHLLIHSQTKTFTCDICNRAFRRKDHLKNHEKVHDPSKTVYTCNYDACSRTYNSLSSFKKHQALHSAEEGQLDCKICKAILPNQEELMNHLKIHSASRVPKGAMDKKFPCTQCAKKFPTKKDLKRHSVVHTGNREFACQYCSSRFGRKDHMTRHAKKTHPEFFTASEVGVGERRLASTPTPAKLEAAKNRKERSISDPGPVQPAALIVSNPTPSQIAMFRPVLSPSRVVTDFQRLGTADAGNVQNSSSMSSTPATFGGENVIYNNIELKSTDFGTIYSKPKESNEPFPFPPSQPATVSVIVSPHNSMLIHRQQHQHQQQPPQLQIPKDQDVLENYYENSSDQLDAQVKSEFDSAETAMKEFMDDKDKIDMESYLKEIDSSYFETKPPATPQLQLGSNFASTIKEEPSSRPTTPSQPIPPMHTIMSSAAASTVGAPTATATVLQPQQEPNMQAAAAIRPAARTLSLASESDVRYSSSVPSHKYSAKHSLLRTQSQDSITRTKNPVLPSVYTEGHLVVPEPKKVHHSFHYDSFSLDLSDESQQFFPVDDDSQNYFQPWH